MALGLQNAYYYVILNFMCSLFSDLLLYTQLTNITAQQTCD